MFDNNNGVAAITQAVQDNEQLFDVVKVQAGRRFIEYVERIARVPLRQLLRELYALRFATGQRRRVLAEANVGKSNVHECVQLLRDHWYVLEKYGGIFNRHLQHFVDVLALVTQLESFAVVALAAANIAPNVHVGQEMHFDLNDAVALASFATTTLDVKTESSGQVAS